MDTIPDIVEVAADGRWIIHPVRPATSPPVLFPGAFNPAHEGHWELAAMAERIARQPVAFELSRINVDKPELADAEIRRRAEQFTARASLWITRAATFADKAELFPGTAFVVGADTADRIVSVRYYGDCRERMDRRLHRLAELGCRFLVAGRVDRVGQFVRLRDLAIPRPFQDLFVEIPEFRRDVSSTALRAQW